LINIEIRFKRLLFMIEKYIKKLFNEIVWVKKVEFSLKNYVKK